MCFSLKGLKIVSTHEHWKYSSAGSLVRLINLVSNAGEF